VCCGEPRRLQYWIAAALRDAHLGECWEMPEAGKARALELMAVA
jgi:hypothetical protein